MIAAFYGLCTVASFYMAVAGHWTFIRLTFLAAAFATLAETLRRIDAHLHPDR